MGRRRRARRTPNVSASRGAITRFCHRWGIIELSIFGSALTEAFRMDSDIDMVARFRPDSRHTLLDLVRMERELSAIYTRSVDLGEYEAVVNDPNLLRRENILSTLEVIFEERPSQLGGYAELGGEDPPVHADDDGAGVRAERSSDQRGGV